MEDDLIPDGQVKATSFTHSSWAPHLARLNHDTAWSTHQLDQDQYIQVFLNTQQYISGVITQGKNNGWVKNYKVEFTQDDINWEFVSNEMDGSPKV